MVLQTLIILASTTGWTDATDANAPLRLRASVEVRRNEQLRDNGSVVTRNATALPSGESQVEPSEKVGLLLLSESCAAAFGVSTRMLVLTHSPTIPFAARVPDTTAGAETKHSAVEPDEQRESPEQPDLLAGDGEIENRELTGGMLEQNRSSVLQAEFVDRTETTNPHVPLSSVREPVADRAEETMVRAALIPHELVSAIWQNRMINWPGLPFECYVVVFLLAGAMLALVWSRRGASAVRASAANDSAVVSTVSLCAPFWSAPSPVQSAAAADGRSTGAWGPIASAIGLAVTAVGGAAILRSFLVSQPGLLRAGMTIAAVGQGILLLGIVAVVISRGRRMGRRRDQVYVQGPFLQYTVPASQNPDSRVTPMNFGLAWPTAFPIVASDQFATSSQVEQLNARLASLSEKIEHLGGARAAEPESRDSVQS